MEPGTSNLSSLTASVSTFAGDIEKEFSRTWQRIQSLEERARAAELRAASAEQVSANLVEKLAEQHSLLKDHIKLCSSTRPAPGAHDKVVEFNNASVLLAPETTAAVEDGPKAPEHPAAVVSGDETYYGDLQGRSSRKTEQENTFCEPYTRAKLELELAIPPSPPICNPVALEPSICCARPPSSKKGRSSTVNHAKVMSVGNKDASLAGYESSALSKHSRMKRKRRRKVLIPENCYEAPETLPVDSDSPPPPPHRKVRASTISACDRTVAGGFVLRGSNPTRPQADGNDAGDHIVAASNDGKKTDRVGQDGDEVHSDQFLTVIHQGNELPLCNIRERTHNQNTTRPSVEPRQAAVRNMPTANINDVAILSSAAFRDSLKTRPNQKSIPEVIVPARNDNSALNHQTEEGGKQRSKSEVLIRTDHVNTAVDDQTEEKLPLSPWLNTRRNIDQELWNTPPTSHVSPKSKLPHACQPASRSHSRKFASVSDAVRFVSRRHDANIRKQAGVANLTVRGKERAALDAAACRECEEFFRREAAGHPDPVRHRLHA